MKATKKILIAIFIVFLGFFVYAKIEPSAFVVNAATKSYKLTQFGSEKFYRIKDIAKKKIDFSKIKTSKTVKYDLDKNNKKDSIKVKTLNETEYAVYVNGKRIQKVSGFAYLYIVDLNTKDKCVDIVIGSLYEGNNETYGIYQKKNNKVKKVGTIKGMEGAGKILTNKKGKIVTRNLPFFILSPFVTDRYYNLSKKGKFSTKKLSVNKISKKIFKCKYELEYAKNKELLNKYYEELDTKYVEVIDANTKFFIVSFEDGWNIKIKLKNGDTGYLATTY